MDSRLPAHLEVSGLLRQVSAEGGFGAVLAKGEREAGTILLVMRENGANPRAYERMPRPDGSREWTLCGPQTAENEQETSDYLSRRQRQDGDLWIIELDIPNGERFIALTGTRG
jgi:hypothetical protein